LILAKKALWPGSTQHCNRLYSLFHHPLLAMRSFFFKLHVQTTDVTGEVKDGIYPDLQLPPSPQSQNEPSPGDLPLSYSLKLGTILETSFKQHILCFVSLWRQCICIVDLCLGSFPTFSSTDKYFPMGCFVEYFDLTFFPEGIKLPMVKVTIHSWIEFYRNGFFFMESGSFFLWSLITTSSPLNTESMFFTLLFCK